MSQVTGIKKIKINGTLLRTKPGSTIKIGGRTRTPQTGHALYGYSEAYEAAVITCTIAHTADVDEDELRDLVDAVVLVETDTGKAYMVGKAFTSTPPELSGDEGDFSMEITGDIAKVL